MSDLFTDILKLQNLNYKHYDNLNLNNLLKFIFIESVTNGGNKFSMLKKLFLDNKFINEENIYAVVNIMCNAQRTLHTLMRFCERINYRYARLYDYNMDMAMVPLDNYKPHLVITLLENNTKYKFKIGDLITIIHKRLCNSNSFFPEPLEIVNPYTNIPISYKNLYKIYSLIKLSNYTMPTLFHQFFLSDFNISYFLDFNECLLKEHIIIEANKNSTQQQKNKRLSAMMYMHRNFFSYRIYSDNRESVLSNVSKLHIHYLRSKYSLNPNIKFTSERVIKNTLKQLQVKYLEKRTVNNYKRGNNGIFGPRQRNDFLFGPLNEDYEYDYDDDDNDNHVNDDDDIELEIENENDNDIENDNVTQITSESNLENNISIMNNWLNTFSDVSLNEIADIASESGDNVQEYESLLSTTSDENIENTISNTINEINTITDLLLQDLNNEI